MAAQRHKPVTPKSATPRTYLTITPSELIVSVQERITWRAVLRFLTGAGVLALLEWLRRYLGF